MKNGEGPAPIKTPQGWLHLAHGVRGCASGLRYVLYLYMTALDDPTRVIAEPAGFFMAPEGEEYIGDVMNVLFANGWICDEDGKVFIYYASSDTRMHHLTHNYEILEADSPVGRFPGPPLVLRKGTGRHRSGGQYPQGTDPGRIVL